MISDPLVNEMRKFYNSRISKNKSEFRLFKKCVRHYVSDDTFKKIATEYNRQVTKMRENS